MFQSVKNGWEICRVSIRTLFHYPKLLAPLLGTWLCFGLATFYCSYFFDWYEGVGGLGLFRIFAIILLGAFILSLACSMLLELIQQQESGKKMSFTEAFLDTLGLNFLAMIPVAFIWGGVWFILFIIEVLFTRNKRRRDDDLRARTRKLTAPTAASFSSSYIDTLQIGVRMVLFLILPGIAWENLSFGKAYQKARQIYGMHLEQFISGFLLTEAAVVLIFLPSTIVFYLSGKFYIEFPQWVWYVTIGYFWIGWSLSIYLEQMYTAEIYLWYLRWERVMWEAAEAGQPIPLLTEIKLPWLLDQTPDLLKMQLEDAQKKKAWEDEIKKRFEG